MGRLYDVHPLSSSSTVSDVSLVSSIFERAHFALLLGSLFHLHLWPGPLTAATTEAAAAAVVAFTSVYQAADRRLLHLRKPLSSMHF